VSTSALVERERKFLPDPGSVELRAVIAACATERRIMIRQAYVLRAGDEGELRLRETITAGTERRVMTVKRGTMPERLEAEIELSAAQWDELRPLVIGTEIRKERFLVELDIAEDAGTAAFGTVEGLDLPHSVLAEIDFFEEPCPGLVLIEVEFPSSSARAAFVPPHWFGREVTGDRRYQNQNLARSAPS